MKILNGAKREMKSSCVIILVALAAQAAADPLTVHLRPGDCLEKGRQAVRDARKAGRLGADEPATVVLEPGVYTVANRFELGSQDGGISAKGVVTYKAERPGTVRLRGGKVVPRSLFVPAAGLSPGACVADVSKLLISPVKEWPDLCKTVPAGPWLYADGAPLPLARWPNEGWAIFTNAVDRGINGPGSFEFVGDRTKMWDVSKGLWMTGYWKHDWEDVCCRVKSIDIVSNVVSFAGSEPFGVGPGTWGVKGRRFYAVNVLSELDAPGEWFLDRKAKKLFYMPDPAKNGEEMVLASFADSFVKLLDDVRYVRFENLDFEYSHAPDVPAIDMVKCADVDVKRCSFSNIAGPAVGIKGERCCVADCRIWNIGGTAVSIDGGNRSALMPSQNLLVRTDIGFYGTLKRTFAPAVSLKGCGSAIRSCRFHDGPYIALWYYGNEHLIADNVFERVVLEAGDSAAIYSGRDSSSWGNVVIGNVIRELGAGSEMAAYRMGVYLDDCDCGDAIIGNELSGIGYGIFMGGGNGNLVANNRIANCQKAIHLDSRGDTWKLYTKAHDGNSWWHSMLKPFDYRAYPWSVLYPAASRMVDDHPNLPWMNTFDGNAVVDCKIDYEFDKTTLSVTNRMKLVKTPRAQPVRLSDAKSFRLESLDGHLAAEFALDVAGRFSWHLEKDGAPVVLSSPLGFTADGRDYGRLVIPVEAVRADSPDFAGVSIPLADLVTGAVVANFEARAYSDSISWRWRIPGTGRRRVNGDGSAWRLAKGAEVDILEKGSVSGFPTAWRAVRAADTYSLVYALSPSGFDVDGEIATPWRETVVSPCGGREITAKEALR